jgi:adenosyl cobinamide kinase/adenosyl cobinamide phosphate guanylyltransferase
MTILQKAAELVGNTTLILGEDASGKSSHAIREAQAIGGDVVWLAFDNLGAVIGNTEANDFAAGLVGSWKEFNDLVKQIKNGEIKGDVVVLDGLHTLAGLCLNSITGGKQPKQAEWGEMGNEVKTALIEIRARIPNMIATVGVQPDDESNLKIALNRDLYNKAIPLFGRKLYAHTKPKKNPTTQAVEGVTYELQDNPTLALRLRPVQK